MTDHEWVEYKDQIITVIENAILKALRDCPMGIDHETRMRKIEEAINQMNGLRGLIQPVAVGLVVAVATVLLTKML